MFILIVVHHLQDPYLGRKNIQMKILSTIFALVVGMFVFDAGLDAQTHWSGKIGGGASTLGNLFDEYPWPHFSGGPTFTVGTAIESTFRKEGMVGWEAGLNLVSSVYYLVPSTESNAPDDPSYRDYDNKKALRHLYVQVPVSLTFNVFEGTGFLLGARINGRLAPGDEKAFNFRKWVPAAHLGIFTTITPRIRLDVTGHIDALYRYDSSTKFLNSGRNEYGATLNFRYILR